jgi:hypothetical protein
MHAETRLTRATSEIPSADMARRKLIKTDIAIRCRPNAAPPTLVHYYVVFWTGPGGLRAPTWPLPALCPGAFWKKSDLPPEKINKTN